MSATLDRRIHDIFDAERQQLLDDLAAAEDRLESKESEKQRMERKLVAANSRLKAELQSIQKEFEQQREANCKAVVGMSRFREKSDAAEEEVVHLRARLEDSEGRYRNERRLRAAAEKSWSEKYTQLQAETLRVRRLADERLGLIDVKQREWSQDRSKLQAQLDALRLEIGREAGLLAGDPSHRHQGGAQVRQTSKQGGSASGVSASRGKQEHDSEQLHGEGGVESEDDELVADAALRRAEREGGHSGQESAPGSVTVGRWEGSRAGDESVGAMGDAWAHRDGSDNAGHNGGFTHAAVRRRQGRLIRELRQRCRQLRAEVHREQMDAEQATEDARKEHQRALDDLKSNQAAQLRAHQEALQQLNERLKEKAAQARQLSSNLKTAERERATLGEQLGKSRAECATVQQTVHELRRELERLVHAGASEIQQRVEAASQSAARVVQQHQTDLRDCRSELAQARSRGATLETELDEARGSIAGLRARLEAARGDAASARAEAAEARTRLEMLESRRQEQLRDGGIEGGTGQEKIGNGESMARGIIGRLHADNARLLQREADLIERCRALEAQHEAGEAQCNRLRGEIQKLLQALEDGRERQGGLKGLIRDLQQDRLRLRAEMKRMQGVLAVEDGQGKGRVPSHPDGSLLVSSTGPVEESKGESGVGFAFGGYLPVGPSVAAQAVRGLVAPASSLQSTPDGGRTEKGKYGGRGQLMYQPTAVGGTNAQAVADAGSRRDRGYVHGARDVVGDETQDPADHRALQQAGVSGLGSHGRGLMDPGEGSSGEWADRQTDVWESSGGGGKAPEKWSGLSTAEFRQDVLMSRQYSPGGGRLVQRRT